MHGQLIKSIMIVFFCITQIKAYGQFSYSKIAWNQVRGPVKSYRTLSYGLVDTGRINSRRLEFFDSVILNRQGQVIETFKSNWFEADIAKKQRVVYRYDTKGNLIEQLRYNTAGTITEKDVYLLSVDKRSVTATRHYLDSDSSRVVARYSVDVLGRIFEMLEYQQPDVPYNKLITYKTRYVYNSNGQVIEEVHNVPTGPFVRKVMYDKDGNVIQQIDTNSSSFQNSFTFTYLSYGDYQNWTQQNRYNNGKQYGVAERLIIYHK